MVESEQYDNLVAFLQREAEYYLRVITVVDPESGSFTIPFIRDDVDDEYPTEADFVDVVSTVLFDEIVGNYNIVRSWDSLIYQFEDGDGNDVLVSLDPEVTDYNDAVALGDQCQELVPGATFEFEPRHPIPGETDPLPDRQ